LERIFSALLQPLDLLILLLLLPQLVLLLEVAQLATENASILLLMKFAILRVVLLLSILLRNLVDLVSCVNKLLRLEWIAFHQLDLLALPRLDQQLLQQLDLQLLPLLVLLEVAQLETVIASTQPLIKFAIHRVVLLLSILHLKHVNPVSCVNKPLQLEWIVFLQLDLRAVLQAVPQLDHLLEVARLELENALILLHMKFAIHRVVLLLSILHLNLVKLVSCVNKLLRLEWIVSGHQSLQQRDLRAVLQAVPQLDHLLELVRLEIGDALVRRCFKFAI